MNFNARQIDVVRVFAFRAQPQVGHGQVVHVDGEADWITRGREVVVARQGDAAGGNLESQRITGVVPERPAKKMIELEVAARCDGIHSQVPAPPEALAGFRGAFERVGVASLGRRAEIAQIERDRFQLGDERIMSGTVLVDSPAVANAECVDEQPHRLRWRCLWLRLLGREPFRQVGQVERAIRPDQHTRERFFERDFLKTRRPPPQRDGAQIHEQPAESQHWLSVRIGEREGADLERQREGVEAYFPDRHAARIVRVDEA